MSSAITVDPTGTGESTLAISEVAERTDITEHTLRYYERIGLLTVGRDGGGRRRYTERDVARVVFVSRLRMSEMPISDIQRYIELVNAGPATEPQRLALLEGHRARVLRRMSELQIALDVIEYKITAYGGTCGT